LQIILFSGTAGSEDVQPLMESGVIVDSLNKTIGKEELIRNISLVARSCA